MSALKELYHATFPASLRYPIGRWRRKFLDQMLRLRTPGPLPPRRLLTRIQETPWVREYLDVGARSADALGAELKGLSTAGETPKVLDFGCGLGRVLRFFVDEDWQLYGCDVDAETLDWSRRAWPGVELALSASQPPLPFPDSCFDAVYSVSVFTHFDADQQRLWATELARVTRPDASALITTMGPRAFSCYPVLAEHRRRFEEEGFYLYRGDVEAEARALPGTARPAFSVHGAFHTRDGLRRFFADGWTLESYVDGGLDGFQDLAVLRRCRETRS